MRCTLLFKFFPFFFVKLNGLYRFPYRILNYNVIDRDLAICFTTEKTYRWIENHLRQSERVAQKIEVASLCRVSLTLFTIRYRETLDDLLLVTIVRRLDTTVIAEQWPGLPAVTIATLHRHEEIAANSCHCRSPRTSIFLTMNGERIPAESRWALYSHVYPR